MRTKLQAQLVLPALGLDEAELYLGQSSRQRRFATTAVRLHRTPFGFPLESPFTFSGIPSILMSTNAGNRTSSYRDIFMDTFDSYMKHFAETPGWFDLTAVALWDSLLSEQTKCKGRGDLVEIGVWKGRSAGLLALHCRPNEQCVFVDIEPLNEFESVISNLLPDTRCTYIQKSSHFLPRHKLVSEIAGNVRWVHIDGEHTAQAVISDLESANLLLSRAGMVAIDDFLSPQYPQVTQAVFNFLFARPGTFSLVLSGFNKGYLCRPTAVFRYAEFIMKSLHAEMSARGFRDITIWKTTYTSDMGSFGITKGFQDRAYRGLDWAEDVIPP